MSDSFPFNYFSRLLIWLWMMFPNSPTEWWCCWFLLSLHFLPILYMISWRMSLRSTNACSCNSNLLLYLAWSSNPSLPSLISIEQNMSDNLHEFSYVENLKLSWILKIEDHKWHMSSSKSLCYKQWHVLHRNWNWVS